MSNIRKQRQNNQKARWYREVFDRDGWECQMPVCLRPDGRAIDPALRSADDPWAPSVDHAVELGRGGSRSAENLRAAHKRCNEVAHFLRQSAEAKGWRVTVRQDRP